MKTTRVSWLLLGVSSWFGEEVFAGFFGADFFDETGFEEGIEEVEGALFGKVECFPELGGGLGALGFEKGENFFLAGSEEEFVFGFLLESLHSFPDSLQGAF